MAQLFANDTIGNLPDIYKPLKWMSATHCDWAFGVAPKCGSSAIRNALLNEGCQYHRVQPQDRDERLFIVRDPIDRFKSLWKNKCRDGGKIRKTKEGEQHPIKGMSPEDLFEYIQTEDNYHWTPQIILLGDVSADIVRLEDMPKWWEAFEDSTQPYPRTNVTKGDLAISDDLMLKLAIHYAEDIEMYEGAT